ncbi:MAG TPA: polyprenyl synthetase family protein [Candidatus Saccharimonadales bacterium]|nr:polyprenyl synthetase family protein [Candidatus Saccharimonadales bacterium]
MAGTAFPQMLAAYKQAVDDDIAAYAKYVRTVTRQQYGEYAALEVDTFLDILSRGGKRIRGVLVMAGYEMCGGQNRAMVTQAARAIEMFHAYLLMCDDIQDRSPLRRGKPSAHELLATYHRRHHLKGDAQTAGVNLALNAAMAGAHAAQVVLANMDADPQLKLNAISITNRTLGITEHGQTYDIMNELVDSPTEEDLQRTLEWKTAQYSFVNPLHVGMVLAGAGCESTDAITPFARHLGKAFQIVDDLLGVFGTEAELGKSPLDDIREGKGTLLTHYALKHAAPADATFLRQCLGNAKLTRTAFTRCQKIIEASGARKYAEALAREETSAALAGLEAGKHLWNTTGHAFLEGLAQYVSGRSR